MLFWIIVTAIAVLVTVLLVLPFLQTQTPLQAGNEDVALYRDQLAEVDRDLERGILAPQDAERTRTEISRRLLAADKTSGAIVQSAPSAVSFVAMGITAVGLIGGSLALYAHLGAPGQPDIPLASRIAASEDARQSRMDQLRAESIAAQLPNRPQATPQQQARLDELNTIAVTDPNDIANWTQIVSTAANAQNFAVAARAQQQVLALGANPTDPGENMRLAILMILAAEGYISPEAETVLKIVLEGDPTNIAARYYYGLLFYETDRPDRAFALFRDVINEGTPDNPFVQMSADLVEEAAFRAGIEYTLPPPAGPSVGDITAAQDLSEEDRNAMISDMVNRLSDRLANEGGPVEEWARLINALSVLGDTDQARAILLEARTLFATSPDAMEQLDFIAVTSGLAE